MTDKRKAAQVYARARTGADRVLDRTAVLPAKAAYEHATGGLMHDLSRTFRGRLREPADALVLGRVKTRLAQGLVQVSRSMGDSFAASTRALMTDGFRTASDTFSAVRGVAGPLDDPAALHRVVNARAAEVQRLRRSSVQGTIGEIHAQVTEQLSRFAFEEEATVGELLSRADEVLGEQAWRVERLARTEASYAYNVAQAEAIEFVAEADPASPVYMRWTEHVVDVTLKPMDSRVGKDSIQMHGQVVKPGRLFRARDDWQIPGEWEHPPNRPNDRAVVLPWMPGWSIPGWDWQGDKQKYLDGRVTGRVRTGEGLLGVEIPEAGLRPESLEHLRAGGAVYGGPVRVGVWPDGRRDIIDGRHRVKLARERGEKYIDATTYEYDAQGNVLRTRDGRIRI